MLWQFIVSLIQLKKKKKRGQEEKRIGYLPSNFLGNIKIAASQRLK